MRLVTIVLTILLVLIQYPLWWGHGGWLHVHELKQQLERQQQKNVGLKLHNEQLAGEVRDLQNGVAAIEERARYELGMVKEGEIFVRVAPDPPPRIKQEKAQPSPNRPTHSRTLPSQ